MQATELSHAHQSCASSAWQGGADALKHASNRGAARRLQTVRTLIYRRYDVAPIGLIGASGPLVL